MSQHNQQIVLPTQILEDYEKMTPEQHAVLRWSGWLFLQRILKPKGLLRKDILEPHEETNAEYLVNMYGFDNNMMRASTKYALMEAVSVGLADASAVSHVDTFFDDLMKLESGVK
jgi:hypothetical protein